MQIQFDPSIDETFTNSPPFLISRAYSRVLVRFTALLRHDEQGRVSKDGGKLQLWSNCPCGTQIDWQAYDFAESTDITKIGVDQQQLSLYLPVILPPGVTRVEFSYTYRAIYPDGRVIWFGKFGQDGVCIINRDGSCGILDDEWYSRDDNVYELNTNGDSRSLEIIRGIEMEKVNVYAINSDGAIGYNEWCSLLFIVPKHKPGSYIVPQTFSISSSPGSSISLSSAGSISVDDVVKTSLLLQVYDDRTNLLPELQRAVSHSIAEEVRILCHKNGVFVLGSSTSHRHTLWLVAIRLSPVTDTRTTELQLDLSEYRGLFANGTNSVCIYPSPNSDITCISRGDITSVRFLAELGTHYTLSPECHFQSYGKLWRISILSDYTNIRMSFRELDAGTLPTPPPSPHVDPVASDEVMYSAEGKIRSVRSAKSSRFIYMRYISALVVMLIFRILSVFKRVGTGNSERQKENHAGQHARGTGSKLLDKHTFYNHSPTPAGRQTANSVQPELCKGLYARVFPGLLAILLRSEGGSITCDPASMFSITLDGEKLDVSIKHEDDSTYLLTSFIDQDGEIEITSV